MEDILQKAFKNHNAYELKGINVYPFPRIVIAAPDARKMLGTFKSLFLSNPYFTLAQITSVEKLGPAKNYALTEKRFFVWDQGHGYVTEYP